MKTLLFNLLIVFNSIMVHAQNLVPNPSFENYNNCPISYSTESYSAIDYILYNTFPTVANWGRATLATSDYYDTCASLLTVGVPANFMGRLMAHTGQAYAGIFASDASFSYAEYLESKLTQQLQPGHRYYASIYMALARNAIAASEQDTLPVRMELYISKIVVAQPDRSRLSLPAQITGFVNYDLATDTPAWVKVQGFYTATGNEQWLTIGDFSGPHSASDYYRAYAFIDDVCVFDVDDISNAVLHTDTMCMYGPSMVLNGHAGGTKYEWSTSDTSARITVTHAGRYWVRTFGECMYYIDTITIKNPVPYVNPFSVICTGGSVQLKAPAGYNYSWSPATGLSCNSCADPIAGPAGSTRYTVTAIDSIGCMDTNNVFVRVDTVTGSFTIQKDTICVGNLLSLINTTTRKDLFYKWYWGNGDTSSQFAPEYVYNRIGTYNIILHVQDSMSCQDTAMLSVTVDSAVALQLITDKSGCIDKEVSLSAVTNSMVRALLWDFGDGKYATGWHFLHNYADSGTFIIKVTAKSVCSDTSVTDTIHVYPYPIVNIGPDTSICPGLAPLTLFNYAGEKGRTNSYLWSTGEIKNSIIIDKPGTYWLQVTTADGCTTTDSIDVRPGCYLHIPNAFSPNEDGINDYFFPRNILSSAVTRFGMQLYNRWGQKVFETTNLDGKGWDGRYNNIPQPEGIYIYMINAAFANGEEKNYQGNITLIR